MTFSRLSVLILLAASLSLVAPLAPAAEGPALESDSAKLFYALGFALSQQANGFALTPEEVEQALVGFREGALRQEPRVDMATYMPKLQSLSAERTKAAAAGERDAGSAWLAKVAAEPGAVKTESGLVYVPLREGTGANPKPTDSVKVHYHGTLRDGTVFDSSVERGQPASFPLNRVIACWTEGLQRMKVGGKAKLLCPPDLAYGDRAPGGKIGPGATLLFEVELLEIQPAE